MRLSLLLSLSLLLCSGQPVRAQLAPPDDFFHSGAQLYISNNLPAALERVASGRQMYPDDEKLKKLEELLKQQQQNQQQQNQQDQQQSKDQQKQNPQNQPSSAKDAQDQPKPDEQKPDPADQKQEEPQKSSADKSDEEKPNGEGQPVQPGQLTPEEAKKLLDAQKGHEQLLQLKPQNKSRDSRRPVKDW
jgi:outer membrane biosynthesis protein TonB